MIQGLKPIPLEELKALSITKNWILKGFIDEFPSISPVKGNVSAKHQESTLLVKGNLKATIKLNCDRCLDTFNETLDFSSKELILIGDIYPDKNNLRGEIHSQDLIVCISPMDKFDPERWAFEQLSLHMPLIKRCNIDCRGPYQLSNSDQITLDYQKEKKSLQIDPRWSELKKLL